MQLTLPAPETPSDNQQQQQQQQKQAPTPLYRTMRLLPLSSSGVCVLNAALPAHWGEGLQQANPPGSYWFFEIMLTVSSSDQCYDGQGGGSLRHSECCTG